MDDMYLTRQVLRSVKDMETFNVYNFEIIIEIKKKLTKKQINKIADYIENVLENSIIEKPKFINDCNIELNWDEEQ
jgi:hypothetical protein